MKKKKEKIAELLSRGIAVPKDVFLEALGDPELAPVFASLAELHDLFGPRMPDSDAPDLPFSESEMAAFASGTLHDVALCGRIRAYLGKHYPDLLRIMDEQSGEADPGV